MRRFLNNRISNYNNVGDKVDDFCEDCENRWLPFSRVWWDSTEKNIADIKRKDNGIFVIKKILSLINSISESIKDIYDRINVIEPPILSEKLIELENDYLEVGVTADDKQEDLNIAIYENYISLKNTKVDKPLIESTSDSLKIVALDNQGESVFIKSSEVGKVKSVNNKIGDVILKTSDLENDSDYTTNLKLNQERDERISGDNLKLDKPTTSGTTTTHPNIVGVDDLGNSAKLKATDFGKVKSVNGKEGDVILKTSDLENDSDYTTNATLTAHTSNKSNPHNVTKSQIGLGNVDNTSDLNKPISTATQTELNKKLDKPTTNNTPDYVLLADGSTAPKSDFGKVDKVMGVEPDANKNVDISGVAMNWTNASQRFSGLVDKSADATYNALLGMDNQGNSGRIENIYNVLVKNLDDMTDTQKNNISTKLNGGYTTKTMSVNTILPSVIQKTRNNITRVILRGSNLNFTPDHSIDILTEDNVLLATISSSEIQLNNEGLFLVFDYNFNTISQNNSKVKFRLKNGSVTYITPLFLKFVDNVVVKDFTNVTWEVFKNDLVPTTSENISDAVGNSCILRLSPPYKESNLVNDVGNSNYALKGFSSKIFEPLDNFYLEATITVYGNNATGIVNMTNKKDIVGIATSNSSKTTMISEAITGVFCGPFPNNYRKQIKTLNERKDGINIPSQPTYTFKVIFIKEGGVISTSVGSKVEIVSVQDSIEGFFISMIYNSAGNSEGLDSVFQGYTFN